MKKIISISASALVMLMLCLLTFTASAGDEETTIPPPPPTKISSCNIVLSSSKLCSTGKAICPKATVKYNKVTLIEGTDYTITYESNIKCGIANAIITGIGDYTGTVKRSFTIVPPKVTGISVSSRATTSLTLKWNAASGAAGYKVYMSTSSDGKYSKCATVKGTSVKISNLSASKKYYFYIIAFGNSDEKFVSEKSKTFTTVTTPSKVTVQHMTKSGTSVKVKWNKTSCKGYQIQYSTDKTFKSGVKSVYVTSSGTTSYTIKKLNKNKTYYGRVRAYSELSGKKYHGSWSSKTNTNYSKLYASYTTSYVNNPDRTNNLKLASKAINGTVIAPGQTFSFNQVVGKRTEAKGYKKAPIFAGQTSTTMGVGGGICQVASTMFNTALNANVKIVERKQHSQKVSYVSNGRDAAIYWGNTDFKWKNNTDYPIKIVMKCENGKITCSFYVCQDASPKKVSLNVTKSGSTYTLKRSVGGKVNYTTKSKY